MNSRRIPQSAQRQLDVVELALPETSHVRFTGYPEYQTCPLQLMGEIPRHWCVKRIKHLGAIRYGLGEPPALLEGGLPFIRATDINAGKINADLIQRVDPDNVPWSRDPVLLADDILVVRSGAYTGDSAIVPRKWAGAIAGYDMVLRCRQAAAQFVAYSLLSRYVLHAQIHTARNRAAQPHLNAEELGAVVLALPPLPEQRAIAAFLDRETAKIDALVAKKRRLIELLQEKRAALISRAVTKGLNPDAPMKDSGIEWLGEVPEHWEVSRLRFTLKSIEQGWSPQCESRQADDGEWGVLKVGCVNGPRFDPSEQKALPADMDPVTRYEIQPGDVLMSRANTRELLGSAAYVEDVRPRLLLCDKLYRIRFDENELDARFAVLAFGSALARYQFERDCDGASGSMKNIGQDTIKNLCLPLPPIAEQRRLLEPLADEFAHIDSLVAKVQEAIDRLLEYRTALISAAVTGKIDVMSVSPADAGAVCGTKARLGCEIG